ncbi:MAG: sulfatase [Pirellulaceae bacterium]
MRRFLLLSCAALLCAEAAIAAEAARPNVLLITSEDNGPDIGCYGDTFARTPNLDRLAGQGVRFERAFVVTASCSESRGGILTGLYPHQSGQIGLATHRYHMYRDDTPNLASLLKAHGYRTGLIGKLHINPASAFPFDFRPKVTEFNSFSRRDVRRVADAAREFFTASDAPFFLMVNYSDAHLPFLRQQAGLPESPLSADDVRPLPWVGLDTPALRQSTADYYNCLARLDTGVGWLLEALEATGKDDDTLVIYLGDHGAQFPRGKLASYESSLRVPLIVRWPGVTQAGVREQLVSTVDLLPTILEATAAPHSDKASAAALPGRSLLPLLQDEPTAWRDHLMTEYHGHYPLLYFPQRTVRDDRYKLIVNLLQDRPNPVAAACTSQAQVSYVSREDVAAGSPPVRQAYATWSSAPPVELYDLERDPHERRNLADDPSLAVVKMRLLDHLRAWQAATNDPLADAEKLRRLTAEHDAIPRPYRRDADFQWRYSDYLAPAP